MTAPPIAAAPATPVPPRRPPPRPPRWTGAATSLLPAVRRALAGASGERAALLVAPPDPNRRRAARLLLQEAARTGGGTLLDSAAGELLLLGALPAAAGRASAALAALGLGTGRLWDLPQDAASLLAWASAAAPAPVPRAEEAVIPETAARAVPLEHVVVRRNLLRLGPGVEPAWLARRIVVSRRRLAAALGPPCATDPELLDAAMAEVEARLAAAPVPVVAGEAGAASSAPPMLRLAWPAVPPAAAASNVPPPPVPGAIAVLPLAAAADPATLAARRAELLAAGWGGLAVDGLDATLLRLINPAALPAETLLLLRWSPDLADRAGLAALRGGLDLTRLVLTGCDSAEEAVGWGLDAGIRMFCGPAVETLIGLARVAPWRPGAA